MRVAKVKKVVNADGSRTYKVTGINEVPFNEVSGINDKLKSMNMQRFFIRRNKTLKSTPVVGKRFK